MLGVDLRELRARAREAAYRTRYLVNAYPRVYMPFTRLKHPGRKEWTVEPDTELVIEGFGRSGSTFAVFAFNLAQRRPVRTAHHTHAAAQVITAVKLGVPTLVIVRKPAQVAASHMARRGIGARAPLAAWVRYHERILPYRDRIVFVSFDQMTSDFGAVTRAVNERFGTSFDEFEHTPENEARVFELIEELNRSKFEGGGGERQSRSLARPTPEREALKRRLGADVDAPALASLRRRAEGLYGAMLPA